MDFIMSVEQSDKIDLVGIDNETGSVVLTISDHLDWSDSQSHQSILQRKLNTYLAFVETGQMNEQYPSSKGKAVAFEIVFKHRPDRYALEFLRKASEVVQAAGFQLRYRVFAESYGN